MNKSQLTEIEKTQREILVQLAYLEELIKAMLKSTLKKTKG